MQDAWFWLSQLPSLGLLGDGVGVGARGCMRR